MKKIFKLVASAALFAVFVFAGCNNYFNNDMYYGNADGSAKEGEKTVKISATTEDGLISFSNSGSARTILSEHLTYNDLAFYLGYKAKGDTDFTWGKIDFTEDDSDTTGCTGTITKNFQLGAYNFVLYAVASAKETSIGDAPTNDGDLKTNGIFVGYAAADLRYNDSVKFYLTSNNLSGTGSVLLNITSDWVVPDDYTIKIGIYDYLTGAQKHPSGQDGTLTPNGETKKINTTGWTAGAAAIAPGNYNIVITAHNNTTGKDYIYSEKLIVLSNRVSKGTIDVPEIIDRAPTQPADLIVGYSKPEDSDINYYKVEFAWTDTAYNERQFQLEVMSVDDASSTPTYITTPTNDTEWNALLSNNDLEKTSTVYVNQIKTYPTPLTTQKMLSESQYAIEGSLNMNNNHIVMYLPLEHRYVARIRASNDNYDTAWTYANLHDADGKTAGCAKDDSITVGSNTFTTKVTTPVYTLGTATDIFPADVTSINQYKITYKLGGGSFKASSNFAADSPDSQEIPATVVFESQHNENGNTASANTTKVAILTPDSKAPIADPATAGVNGKKNTYVKTSNLYTTYASVTPLSDIYVELTDVEGYYWADWLIDGKSASVYGKTDGTCNPYLGYTNLTLFAKYNVLPPSADITSSVTLADINKYELKKEYVEITLNSSGTDITKSIVMANGGDDLTSYTFNTMPKLTELNYGDVSTIGLKISGTSLKDANDTAFAYDKVRAVVTKLTPSNNREILNTSFDKAGTDWTTTITGIDTYSAAIYYIEVQATSSKYPLVTFSQKITLKVIND